MGGNAASYIEWLVWLAYPEAAESMMEVFAKDQFVDSLPEEDMHYAYNSINCNWYAIIYHQNEAIIILHVSSSSDVEEIIILGISHKTISVKKLWFWEFPTKPI